MLRDTSSIQSCCNGDTANPCHISRAMSFPQLMIQVGTGWTEEYRGKEEGGELSRKFSSVVKTDNIFLSLRG